jgi:hypothetical protein
MFRGRYVYLRYEISTLPVKLLKDARPQDLKGGETLVVKLKKEGEYWQAEGVYLKHPDDQVGVYLLGRLPYYYGKSDNLTLEYGIESFFLNEKSADIVDKAARRGLDWRERDRRRKEAFAKLDAQTRRIHDSGINERWLKSLKTELEIWVKERLIDQKTKERIDNKYSVALEKISGIEKSLDAAFTGQREPIKVEIAIDRAGNGYPVRLFCGGKVYE